MITSETPKKKAVTPRELREVVASISMDSASKADRGRPPTPSRRQAQEESRHDDAVTSKNIPSVDVDRDASNSNTTEHPPSEIIVHGTPKKQSSLNRFGFPAPSPTNTKKAATAKKKMSLPQDESRNEEAPGDHTPKVVPLPPRPPTPTAFSFDGVISLLSTAESNPSEMKPILKVETLDSHTTPILRNAQEAPEEREIAESLSHASTVSSDRIPLRRDSYVSFDVEPEPDTAEMEPQTPHSVPFDENTFGDDIESDDEEEEEEEKVEEASEEKVQAEAATGANDVSVDEANEEQAVSLQPETPTDANHASSPTSHTSESSMRSQSILDRENSFTGPLFVEVAPTDDAERAQDGDWIEQVTECVACDDGKAATQNENNETESVVDEEESAERKAADQAYASCEVEGADLQCIELTDETEAEAVAEEDTAVNEPAVEVIKEEIVKEENVEEETSKDTENPKEEWLENATEWARYDKPATPTPNEPTPTPAEDEQTNENVTVAEEDPKPPNTPKVILAPSDEGFFDAARQHQMATRSSEKSSADGTACSTVALTDASNGSRNTNLYGTFQRGTSEGEFDEFLDRVTDCVTCWKLEPWPELEKEK